MESPGSTGYIPGILPVDDLLIPLLPRMKGVNIETKTVASVGSHELRWDDLWKIHSAVSTAIKDPLQQGVVVTIGTDLGAAMAFFLDMTIETNKPIVLVGAMRPATALSADGWSNLLNAIDIARSTQARGRGVLWTSNGEIHSAFFVQKSHTAAPDAFRSPGPGPLGFLQGFEPLFYYPPSRPLARFGIDPVGLDQADMPPVAIIIAHRDMLPGQIRAVVRELNVKGLIIAGLGAGSWPPDMAEEVRTLEQSHGIIVVTARQTFGGHVLTPDVGIPGGFLDVHKCQVAVQVFLSLGYNHDVIKAAFAGQGRKELEVSPICSPFHNTLPLCQGY
jgi:L-asparaginase